MAPSSTRHRFNSIALIAECVESMFVEGSGMFVAEPEGRMYRIACDRFIWNAHVLVLPDTY